MRVVFMGTPQFAVPSLMALAKAHDVVAVYTRPDSVSGRGTVTRPSAVKQAAESLGLDVRQPATLRDVSVHAGIREFAPDIVVVAAYGLILPREILEVPPQGCINVHASLLPRWRGAAPIQRAILAGDEETGVSIMRMEEGLDTGPVCASVRVEIDEKPIEQLTTELADVGATAVLRTLGMLSNGTCQWVRQDDALATYADKLEKADVALSPDLTVSEALRRIRASSSQAASRATIAGRGMTILTARRGGSASVIGGVLATKTDVVLGLADGALAVDEVKPDGRGPMAAADWARGLRLTGSERWTGAR